MTEQERVEINSLAVEIMDGIGELSDIFKAGKRIYDLTKDPQSDWTPCAEGLPAKNADGTYSSVRVTYKEWDGSLCVTDAVYIDDFKEWSDVSGETQRNLETVLAWKPQDEPWSGEVKEASDGTAK